MNLQRLQDMLAAMQLQRDNALNAVVVAQAEIAARDRTLAERDARIKALEDELAKVPPTDAQTPLAEAA